MLVSARRLVPVKIKRLLRRHLEKRKARRLFGSLAALVPPVEQMFDGPGSLEEFKRNGEEFLDIYKEQCNLEPHEHILDIGSGIGRKTIPLTQYLHPSGRYEGIDVNPLGVQWCRDHITGRFPNFRFQLIDACNRLYNPGGTVLASELRLPFEDRSFTFVAVQSVFTHMLPHETDHYLSEIARVLDGGRCLASFFLLNDESRHLIESDAGSQRFVHEKEGWATTSPAIPETAIAIDEALVRSFITKAGLRIVRQYPGSWCGRDAGLSYQDLLLIAGQSSPPTGAR